MLNRKNLQKIQHVNLEEILFEILGTPKLNRLVFSRFFLENPKFDKKRILQNYERITHKYKKDHSLILHTRDMRNLLPIIHIANAIEIEKDSYKGKQSQFLDSISGIVENSTSSILQTNKFFTIHNLYYVAVHCRNITTLKININPRWIHDVDNLMNCLNTLRNLEVLQIDGFLDKLKLPLKDLKKKISILYSASSVKYLLLNNHLLVMMLFFRNVKFLQVTTDFFRKTSSLSTEVVSLSSYFNKKAEDVQILSLPKAQMQSFLASVSSSRRSTIHHKIIYITREGPLKGAICCNEQFDIITRNPALDNDNLVIVENPKDQNIVVISDSDDDIIIVDNPESKHNVIISGVSSKPCFSIQNSNSESSSNKLEVSSNIVHPKKELSNPLLMLSYAADYLENNKNGDHRSNTTTNIGHAKEELSNPLLMLSYAADYVKNSQNSNTHLQGTSNKRKATDPTDAKEAGIPTKVLVTSVVSQVIKNALTHV